MIKKIGWVIVVFIVVIAGTIGKNVGSEMFAKWNKPAGANHEQVHAEITSTLPAPADKLNVNGPVKAEESTRRDAWMALSAASTFWAPIISALFAVVSAIVAWLAVARPQKHAESQAIMDQAILSLERAWNVLTDDGKVTSPPPASRVNWLTSARHIVTYQDLRERVTNETHQLILDDHAEWWRHKFYMALKMHRLHDIGYYKNEGAGQGRELAKSSLIVICDFATWPDDRDDPLTADVVRRAVSRKYFLNGNIGLQMYLNLHD